MQGANRRRGDALADPARPSHGAFIHLPPARRVQRLRLVLAVGARGFLLPLLGHHLVGRHLGSSRLGKRVSHGAGPAAAHRLSSLRLRRSQRVLALDACRRHCRHR
eukprot:423964-Prymnesium_polylepis.1